MTTLAIDSPVTGVLGEFNSVPIIATDIVYEGAMVGDNGSGYGRPLVAADKFLGHAIEKVDNAAGAAGAKEIRLRSGRYKLVVALAGYITDVGQPVYASDDATYTFVGAGASAANSYVGVVTRYVSAALMEVEFRPGEVDEFGNNLNRILKSADYTALLADSGKIIYVDTDTKVITLTAIATLLSGYEITVVNAGVGILIAVDPTTDLISGGCGLGAGGGGKQFRNTANTAKRGDFIKLAGNATGWNITNLRGTWAIES
jgi:hypothetical protein